MSYGNGENSGDILELLTSTENSAYYKYTGDEIYCEICGKLFDTVGAKELHKSSYHYNTSVVKNDSIQWDFGQNDLRNGLNLLWNDFMKEHDLPKVVFLLHDDYKSSIKHNSGFMPIPYENKAVDDVTGESLYGIYLNDNWQRIDIDAKCASLAHCATHIENYRAKARGVSTSKTNRHTKVFKNTAITYDLFVQNVPVMGYAMTLLTPAFKKKHKRAMTLIARYHHISLKDGKRMNLCKIDM